MLKSIYILATTLLLSTCTVNGNDVEPEVAIIPKTGFVKMEEPTSSAARVIEVKTLIQSSSMIVEPDISEEDVELIALVTMAEAEGESELGKRLVIDTILNRMDHERFPDTISEVIYQPDQFTSMWNGRVDRCYVDDNISQLVREEMKNRTNSETIFFSAGEYSKYGTPMFSEGNHYFSSYE